MWHCLKPEHLEGTTHFHQLDCHFITNTVGIWIPDLCGIVMVESYLIAKWSGTWMPFEPEKIHSSSHTTIWILGQHSNGGLNTGLPFEYLTSEYHTSKSPLVRYFRYSYVCCLNPDCNNQTSHKAISKTVLVSFFQRDKVKSLTDNISDTRSGVTDVKSFIDGMRTSR